MESPDKSSQIWNAEWTCCPRLEDCNLFFGNSKRTNQSGDSTCLSSSLKNNDLAKRSDVDSSKSDHKNDVTSDAGFMIRRNSECSSLSCQSKGRRESTQPTTIASLTNLVRELFRNEVRPECSNTHSVLNKRLSSSSNCVSGSNRDSCPIRVELAAEGRNCMSKPEGNLKVSREPVFQEDLHEKCPSSRNGMSSTEWRKIGKEMVDYIANYLDSIGSRRVTPKVEPGYLRPLLPDKAPLKSEKWERIMQDFDKLIMPGITHWQHPRFHAYFPSGVSYPSILADMLSNAIGCIGFSWAASPACTELETILLDWVGKAIGLPDGFLSFSSNSKGGGVIQGSASDCGLVTLLAARFHTIKQLKQKTPQQKEGEILSQLIAYCSKEAHSLVEKAAMIGFVKLRILDTDEQFRMKSSVLAKAIQDDKAMGLVPFFVSTTLGTTSCCSFDPIDEIGEICAKEELWLHVDAAYAGNAFICPEFQYLLKGIQYASSFNINPNKFMLVNFDCSLLWVKDRFKLTQAFVVDPLYLQHSYSDNAIDYRHWGIPLSRRFRALKLWFVLRSYGIEGIQCYVRKHCRLAKYFERIMLRDDRFEIMNNVTLGLVCFRLKGSNDLNQKLLSSINASGELHMVPASLNDKFVIRFCVCAEDASEKDILFAYETISQFASNLLEVLKLTIPEPPVKPAATIEKEAIKVMEKKDSIPEETGKMDEQNEEDENEHDLEPLTDEKEAVDRVVIIDRRKKQSLRYKRSFFVRMVSDPKLYNPKIVKNSNDQTSDETDCNEIVSPI